MNPTKLINQHQTCIEILEGIRRIIITKELTQQSIDGFPGTFPELRRKYIHRLEILDKCIKRLHERYEKNLPKAS